MKKIFSFLILLIIFSPVLLLSPNLANATTTPAQTPPGQLNPLLNRLQTVADQGGYVTDPNSASAAKMAGRIVRAFINFLGITFIILAIYAGYGWMTAGGNEEKVKKSVSTLKQAVIGMLVAVSAWTLWNFVFEKLIIMG